MSLNLDTLHGIIDAAQSENRDTEFNVALVDEKDMGVYRISEVYVDADNGIISLVFDSNKRVGK